MSGNFGWPLDLQKRSWRHFWYTTRQLHEFFFNGKALQQKAEISGSRGVRL